MRKSAQSIQFMVFSDYGKAKNYYNKLVSQGKQPVINKAYDNSEYMVSVTERVVKL